MEGFIGGLILAFFLTAFTYFFCVYALLVKLPFTRKFHDVLRLILSAAAAVFFAYTSMWLVFIFMRSLLITCVVLMFVSIRYLVKMSPETLAKPRNMILLFKYRVSRRTWPWAFSLVFTLLNLTAVFFLTVLFFPS